MVWKHSSTIYVINPIVGTCTNFFCNLKHNALIWLDGGNLIACDFSCLFLITFLLLAVHVSNTFLPFVFDNKYCTYISISNSSLKHSQNNVPCLLIHSNIWYLFIRQVLYILSSGSFYNFDSSFMVAFTSFYFIIFESEYNPRLRLN